MTDSVSEQAFASMADSLLNYLEEVLGEVSDAELQGGVLSVQAEAGTLLVNKHAPTRQIWLSSPKHGGRHYAFDPALGLWRDTRGAGDLLSTLSDELGVPLEWQPA
jgi:frataxin